MAVICSSKREICLLTIEPPSEFLDAIEVYLRTGFQDNYVVAAYHDRPKEGCSHAFATYEEARACYMDALLILTSKDIYFRQVADVITHPPYHPELYL